MYGCMCVEGWVGDLAECVYVCVWMLSLKSLGYLSGQNVAKTAMTAGALQTHTHTHHHMCTNTHTHTYVFTHRKLMSGPHENLIRMQKKAKNL